MNRKIEDLLGYTMEEWLDQPDMWIEVLHPDDREVELAAHDLHSSTGDPWRREYRLIGADGQVVWVRDQATLMRDLDGNPIQWQGVMIDITAEKEAQTRARTRPTTSSSSACGHAPPQLEEANELMGIEIAERQRAEDERDRAIGSSATPRQRARRSSTSGRRARRDDGDVVHLRRRPDRADARLHPEEWNDGGWREPRPPARPSNA